MLYEKTSSLKQKDEKNDKMNKDKIIIPAQNKADARQMAECRLIPLHAKAPSAMKRFLM